MWLDRLSDFIARYKGFPTMVAVVLVILNFIFLLAAPFLASVIPFIGGGILWVAEHHVLLHLGIVIGFIGLLLDEALG